MADCIEGLKQIESDLFDLRTSVSGQRNLHNLYSGLNKAQRQNFDKLVRDYSMCIGKVYPTRVKHKLEPYKRNQLGKFKRIKEAIFRVFAKLKTKAMRETSERKEICFDRQLAQNWATEFMNNGKRKFSAVTFGGLIDITKIPGIVLESSECKVISSLIFLSTSLELLYPSNNPGNKNLKKSENSYLKIYEDVNYVLECMANMIKQDNGYYFYNIFNKKEIFLRFYKFLLGCCMIIINSIYEEELKKNIFELKHNSEFIMARKSMFVVNEDIHSFKNQDFVKNNYPMLIRNTIEYSIRIEKRDVLEDIERKQTDEYDFYNHKNNGSMTEVTKALSDVPKDLGSRYQHTLTKKRILNAWRRENDLYNVRQPGNFDITYENIPQIRPELFLWKYDLPKEYILNRDQRDDKSFEEKMYILAVDDPTIVQNKRFPNEYFNQLGKTICDFHKSVKVNKQITDTISSRENRKSGPLLFGTGNNIESCFKAVRETLEIVDKIALDELTSKCLELLTNFLAENVFNYVEHFFEICKYGNVGTFTKGRPNIEAVYKEIQKAFNNNKSTDNPLIYSIISRNHDWSTMNEKERNRVIQSVTDIIADKLLVDYGYQIRIEHTADAVQRKDSSDEDKMELSLLLQSRKAHKETDKVSVVISSFEKIANSADVLTDKYIPLKSGESIETRSMMYKLNDVVKEQREKNEYEMNVNKDMAEVYSNTIFRALRNISNNKKIDYYNGDTEKKEEEEFLKNMMSNVNTKDSGGDIVMSNSINNNNKNNQGRSSLLSTTKFRNVNDIFGFFVGYDNNDVLQSRNGFVTQALKDSAKNDGVVVDIIKKYSKHMSEWLERMTTEFAPLKRKATDSNEIEAESNKKSKRLKTDEGTKNCYSKSKKYKKLEKGSGITYVIQSASNNNMIDDANTITKRKGLLSYYKNIFFPALLSVLESIPRNRTIINNFYDVRRNIVSYLNNPNGNPFLFEKIVQDLQSFFTEINKLEIDINGRNVSDEEILKQTNFNTLIGEEQDFYEDMGYYFNKNINLKDRIEDFKSKKKKEYNEAMALVNQARNVWIIFTVVATAFQIEFTRQFFNISYNLILDMASGRIEQSTATYDFLTYAIGYNVILSLTNLFKYILQAFKFVTYGLFPADYIWNSTGAWLSNERFNKLLEGATSFGEIYTCKSNGYGSYESCTVKSAWGVEKGTIYFSNLSKLEAMKESVIPDTSSASDKILTHPNWRIFLGSHSEYINKLSENYGPNGMTYVFVCSDEIVSVDNSWASWPIINWFSQSKKIEFVGTRIHLIALKKDLNGKQDDIILDLGLDEKNNVPHATNEFFDYVSRKQLVTKENMIKTVPIPTVPTTISTADKNKPVDKENHQGGETWGEWFSRLSTGYISSSQMKTSFITSVSYITSALTMGRLTISNNPVIKYLSAFVSITNIIWYLGFVYWFGISWVLAGLTVTQIFVEIAWTLVNLYYRWKMDRYVKRVFRKYPKDLEKEEFKFVTGLLRNNSFPVVIIGGSESIVALKRFLASNNDKKIITEGNQQGSIQEYTVAKVVKEQYFDLHHPPVNTLWSYAKKLEGMVRNVSEHSKNVHDTADKGKKEAENNEKEKVKNGADVVDDSLKQSKIIPSVPNTVQNITGNLAEKGINHAVSNISKYGYNRLANLGKRLLGDDKSKDNSGDSSTTTTKIKNKNKNKQTGSGKTVVIEADDKEDEEKDKREKVEVFGNAVAQINDADSVAEKKMAADIGKQIIGIDNPLGEALDLVSKEETREGVNITLGKVANQALNIYNPKDKVANEEILKIVNDKVKETKETLLKKTTQLIKNAKIVDSYEKNPVNNRDKRKEYELANYQLDALRPEVYNLTEKAFGGEIKMISLEHEISAGAVIKECNSIMDKLKNVWKVSE